MNGEVFDSSVDRDTPVDLAPSDVIPGWTEILQLMVEGDKFEAYIPSDLAYGPRGAPPTIGPDQALIFTIELIKIKGEREEALLCDPRTLEDCDERERIFILKMLDKSSKGFDLDSELKRLSVLQNGVMNKDLNTWFKKRAFILTKLLRSDTKEQTQEEL
jgi:hypothetical protein